MVEISLVANSGRVPMVCMQTVEIYLASQHLRVATLRSEEGKLKLRISIEDEG
jgi:hypothetical protein